jgi:hypothetical protein
MYGAFYAMGCWCYASNIGHVLNAFAGELVTLCLKDAFIKKYQELGVGKVT